MKNQLLLSISIILCTIVLSSCSSDGDSDLPAENSNTFVENTILNSINEHRNSLSLLSLEENSVAKQLAFDHAQFMANQRELSIDGNSERKTRLQETENATAVVEFNSRFYSPEELVQNWLREGSTTKNSLESNFSNVGIAVTQDEVGQNYYTLIMFRMR
ncbi:CAP domain-containing protein [Aquimarina sp. U1-2]|uniref:CAP domain-containing protein n=1 Tax=Aquimarina sp. U1-2 TaxID=2823141 RepID=UPI001AECA750|nr:CAP domain-containing protein [Aquimarina sp. U1-2]MBP2834046.1 CAP domain-containing protein [Aquimarina sp. U1-2]